ncbi:MAG: flagellar brake protein [Gammaproteobacteria bacterium]|nr:flagellar brake protein [Gammaproteobacteria bacterium]
MSEPQREDVPAEIITATSYIAALLQRMVTERLLISVTPAGSNAAPLTSTVLQVLPNEGVFLLDDLFPQPPAQAIPSDIIVAAQFTGASLRFAAKVAAPQEETGLRLWRILLPESVEYRQARSDHRIAVFSLEIPVRLFLGEGVVLPGVLQDVCTQGIGVRVAKVNGLKRGKVYRCSIDHGDDESVEVEIEPTRVEKAEGELPLRLGLRLHDMSRHEQWQWQRFAVELERRLLRHQ